MRTGFLLALLTLILLPPHSVLADAEVRLLTAPYIREGRYVPVLVRGAGPGAHTLGGDHVVPVAWDGSFDVIVPLLVLDINGRQLALVLDGQPVTLEVDPLAPGHRLAMDASPTGMSADAMDRIADALFPGQVVRTVSVRDAADPAAFELTDAVILDSLPPPDRLADWQAAGVDVVVLGPVDGWRALGLADASGPWVAPPARGAAIGATDPDIYAAVASWEPGRPAGERRAVFAGAAAFVLLAAACLWAGRTMRAQGMSLVVLSIAAAGAVLGWVALRADLAVRQADVIIAGGSGMQDRWLFLRGARADQPTDARIAFTGVTRPVGFDRRHLSALSPVVHLDRYGHPAELTLTLPPGFTASVLQRTGGAQREDSVFEPWARPLVRQWYTRRLGAIQVEETPTGAILRP
jgi:hypothetical protein